MPYLAAALSNPRAPLAGIRGCAKAPFTRTFGFGIFDAGLALTTRGATLTRDGSSGDGSSGSTFGGATASGATASTRDGSNAAAVESTCGPASGAMGAMGARGIAEAGGAASDFGDASSV